MKSLLEFWNVLSGRGSTRITPQHPILCCPNAPAALAAFGTPKKPSGLEVRPPQGRAGWDNALLGPLPSLHHTGTMEDAGNAEEFPPGTDSIPLPAEFGAGATFSHYLDGEGHRDCFPTRHQSCSTNTGLDVTYSRGKPTKPNIYHVPHPLFEASHSQGFAGSSPAPS